MQRHSDRYFDLLTTPEATPKPRNTCTLKRAGFLDLQVAGAALGDVEPVRKVPPGILRLEFVVKLHGAYGFNIEGMFKITHF